MFQLSGGIGMILFYIAWSDLWYRLQGVHHGEVISWTVAYAASILWQHLLNRTLVWTDLQTGYWESLSGIAAVYGFSLVLSSILNVLFVEVLYVSANFAFFVTAVFTGAVNYVMIVMMSEDDSGRCECGGAGGGDSDNDDERDREGNLDPVVHLATNMVASISLPPLTTDQIIRTTQRIQQLTAKQVRQWTRQDRPR